MNRSVGRRVAVALVVVVAAAGVAIAGSAVLGGGASGRAPAAPRFVEEASAAGIDHTFGGEDQWFVGGGVAVFDCDDDHRPDLYLAGGAGPGAPRSQRKRGRREPQVHAGPRSRRPTCPT